MRILVFNHHEPYIELFAATGHDFWVAPPVNAQRNLWRRAFRPVPENVKLCSTEEALRWSSLGEFDLVIALSFADLEPIAKAKRRMFVELNMLSENLGIVGDTDTRGLLTDGLAAGNSVHLNGCEIVFISEKKRRDWGMAGEGKTVIVSGVDTAYWHPCEPQSQCEIPKVLRIGNMLKQRDEMQGYSVSERILADIPSQTIGIQADAIESFWPQSKDRLRAEYCSHRVMLSCLDEDREDGYNLAVLEAMSCGVSVVCMPNTSRPTRAIWVEGEQHAKILLNELLRSQEMAAFAGYEARQDVIENFNLSRCADEWDGVFRLGAPEL